MSGNKERTMGLFKDMLGDNKVDYPLLKEAFEASKKRRLREKKLREMSDMDLEQMRMQVDEGIDEWNEDKISLDDEFGDVGGGSTMSEDDFTGLNDWNDDGRQDGRDGLPDDFEEEEDEYDEDDALGGYSDYEDEEEDDWDDGPGMSDDLDFDEDEEFEGPLGEKYYDQFEADAANAEWDQMSDEEQAEWEED